MLTLTSILATIGAFAHYAWVLLLLLIPQVLDLIKPVWETLWNGLNNLASSIWQGAKAANFNTWILVLILSALTGAVGYHYGWYAAIDWGHEHFRWIAKKAITPWWKFW